MVYGSTVHGGVKSVHDGVKAGIASLSPAERHAAINALSKLTKSGTASSGVSSVFGGALKSATLSGGSVLSASIKTPGGTTLVSGRGADTFAGGVRSGAKPTIHAIGSDTVVAGSAFGKTELTNAGGSRALTGDTISVAGVTAAGVKTAQDVKSTGHTITMADKTNITLTGITPHNVTKPH
jgi:hypothetical protein